MTLAVSLRAELATTRAELAAARIEIVELRARLGKNSQNSSKPPSTDLPGAVVPERKGRRKRKQRGGRPGHQGHFAAVPKHVDHVHQHRASRCVRGHDLTKGKLTGTCGHHYVYELPEIRPVVHDHQCLDVACPRCDLITRGSLPVGVPTGQYGPSVQAMTGLLRGEMRQSVRQTSVVMTNVMHIPMSTGMVAKTQDQVSQALAAPFQEALQFAQAHDRVHADETSWRQDKKKAWLWVAVAGMVTVFLIRASRSATAAKDLLGASFGGVLMTDRWGSYNWVSTTQRQLCWSHLKRDFKSFLDYGSAAKQLGERLLCEHRRMFRLWHQVRDGTLSRLEFQLAMKVVRRRILALLEEGKALPCAKVSGMCKHILKFPEALFTFVDTERVEPTNNAAERAVRFAVLWRKGCFGSDSERGSRFVERILTVRATLRTQQRDLYAYLKAACTAALNGAAAPSLLPQSVPSAPDLSAAA